MQGWARLEKDERNQSSDVHNTMVVNSSRPSALWGLVVCPSACLPVNVWTKWKVCLPLYDMLALAELFILYRPSQHNERWKESTAQPTTCNHRAGQEQEASCYPPSCKNRTAKFRMPTQNNNFMTALFFGEPGVAQLRAARLCNFRVSTLKTLLGKH